LRHHDRHRRALRCRIDGLGKSDKYRIDNTFTMFSNGNNVGVADDMVRRTIRCGLDAGVEYPESRTFKKNPLDLIR